MSVGFLSSRTTGTFESDIIELEKLISKYDFPGELQTEDISITCGYSIRLMVPETWITFSSEDELNDILSELKRIINVLDEYDISLDDVEINVLTGKVGTVGREIVFHLIRGEDSFIVGSARQLEEELEIEEEE